MPLTKHVHRAGSTSPVGSGSVQSHSTESKPPSKGQNYSNIPIELLKCSRCRTLYLPKRYIMLVHCSSALTVSAHRGICCTALVGRSGGVRLTVSFGITRTLSSQRCSARQQVCTQMAAEERAAAAEHSRKAWEMFKSWGSPKHFVAPMVDQASCSGLVILFLHACRFQWRLSQATSDVSCHCA